jgi:hypothetical protein
VSGTGAAASAAVIPVGTLGAWPVGMGGGGCPGWAGGAGSGGGDGGLGAGSRGRGRGPARWAAAGRSGAIRRPKVASRNARRM